jgi:hypothetical protein
MPSVRQGSGTVYPTRPHVVDVLLPAPRSSEVVVPPHLLAHAGAGSTWQAMVSVVALGLVVVVALAAAGRLELRAPGDLVLPLAAVAILSSLAPLGDRWLSDWIGWAFPLGVVALLGILLAAFTPLRLAADGVLLYVVIGLGVAGAIVLYRPLTIAWHPPADMLPDPGAATIAILEPEEDSPVPAGETTVEVTVDGGSIGPGGVPFEELSADHTEAGALGVEVAGERVPVDLDQACTQDDPCERVSFPVELPAGDEVALRVEFLRGDGMPFGPPVFDRVELLVE